MSGTKNLNIGNFRIIAYIAAAILTVFSVLYVFGIWEAPDALVAAHLAATAGVYFLTGSLGAVALMFRTGFRVGRAAGNLLAAMFWFIPFIDVVVRVGVLVFGPVIGLLVGLLGTCIAWMVPVIIIPAYNIMNR